MNLILLSSSLKAQSSEYTIESFQDTYTELDTYQSMVLLQEGSPIWEYEFQLEFPFPFYDSTYTRLIYNYFSWGQLTDDQDDAFLLMDVLGAYSYDFLHDTSNITSDVRFSHVQVGGIKAFVIQFTKVGFFGDPYADFHDTYLNFQMWFYENGFIDVHFGDIHLDDNPIYAPGVGFYCYTTSGGIDTMYAPCGPHMGISNPIDKDNAIGLQGTYDEYEVVGTPYGILTNMPPEGWVIRFKPTGVGIRNLKPDDDHFVISPNPTNSVINLPVMNSNIVIMDGTGRIVFKGSSERNSMDVSFLASGMYYVQVCSNKRVLFGKFIKN